MSLQRALKRELDWIVMRCLEKEPAGRYGSARDLADDVERYMSGLPTKAGPQTNWYLLRKFARRHRVPVISGLFLVAGLIAGVTALSLMYREARFQETDANAALSLVRNLIGAANPANQFGGPLSVNTPPGHQIASGIDHGIEPITAVTLLDNLRIRLGESGSTISPYRQAFLRAELCQSYGFLAFHTKALEQCTIAYDLLASSSSSPPEFLVSVAISRAAELSRVEGVTVALQALTELEQNHPSVIDEHDEQSLRFRYLKAQLLIESGGESVLKGQQVLEELLPVQRNVLGETHSDVCITLNQLGQAAHIRAEWSTAEGFAKESLQCCKQSKGLGELHPHTLSIAATLGYYMTQGGKVAEARDLLEQLEPSVRRTLGDRHPHYWRTLQFLASAVIRTTKSDDSYLTSLIDRVEALAERYGPTNPKLAAQSFELRARTLWAQKRWSEAAEAYAKALKFLRPNGIKSDDGCSGLQAYALSLKNARDPRAEGALREVVELFEEYYGSFHLRTITSALYDLAKFHREHGELRLEEEIVTEMARRLDTEVNRTMAVRSKVILWEGILTWNRGSSQMAGERFREGFEACASVEPLERRKPCFDRAIGWLLRYYVYEFVEATTGIRVQMRDTF